MFLTADVIQGGFSLGIERVEGLIEALIVRLAGVDRAAEWPSSGLAVTQLLLPGAGVGEVEEAGAGPVGAG
ncbi:MAG: hypothetical protein AAF663_03250, partial [Planctomycetota bacterium]